MYRGSETKVRCVVGETSNFGMKFRLHNRSALSPYLFHTLLDVLTDDLTKDALESMMLIDVILLCGGKEVDMTGYTETWRHALEERGKTQFMDLSFQRNEEIDRHTVNNYTRRRARKVTHFKYLESGWRNWKKCSDVEEDNL